VRLREPEVLFEPDDQPDNPASDPD
jgi:hypothetical protein